jgi:hypothetical protein
VSNRVKKTLAGIAVWTGVPADLIAIIPVVYSILASIKIVPEIKLNTAPLSITGNIHIPLRDICFVALFYGFSALLYWKGQKIQSQRRLYWTDALRHLRQLSIMPPLLLLIPATLLAITFHVISLIDGLAAIVVWSLLTWFLWRRWHLISPQGPILFSDIGLWYLLWVPLTWLCLELNPTSYWLDNIGWSLVFASIGYLLLLGITIPIAFAFRRLKLLDSQRVKVTLNHYGIALALALLSSYIGIGRAFLPTDTFGWACVGLPVVAVFLLIYFINN